MWTGFSVGFEVFLRCFEGFLRCFLSYFEVFGVFRRFFEVFERFEVVKVFCSIFKTSFNFTLLLVSGIQL